MKTLTREITLETRSANDAERTVSAVISTQTPVDVGGWKQVLLHTKNAIDLSRSPLPLLHGHDTRLAAVGIVENLTIDNGKLRGVVRMGKSTQATELWTDIKSGVVRGLSVGFTVSKWERDEDALIETAVAWQPHEASVVGVPLDPSAGFNRNLTRENTMPDENTEDTNVIQPHERWLKQEQNRRTEIRSLFQMHRGVDDLLNGCLDDTNCSADRASKLLLTELGKQHADPMGGGFRQSSNGGSLSQRDLSDVGRRAFGDFTAKDSLGEFADAAIDGTLLRAGAKIEKPHPGAQDVRNMRMSDIAETVLRQFGVRTSGMSRDQLVRKALSTRALISHSTSDFTNILENISEKSLLIGFQEIGGNYRRICRIGSLPDFKQGSRVALSDFEDLEIVYENGEYKVGSYTDTGVKLQLQTYGKLFNISRQALINDDLNSFIGIPRGMGAAAVRAVDDACFNVLTSNPTMGDGDTLFHSNHSNDVPNGSGAAPSVSTIDAAFTAMTTQTGPGGAHLNVTPRLLIVPQALATTSRVIANSINDPNSSVLAAPNPFAGEIDVVSDARLDSDDAARWYMAAAPGAYDTVECAFLDGMEQPFLETRDGWTQDGAEFKARIDFTCAALDYRGMYRNDGD